MRSPDESYTALKGRVERAFAEEGGARSLLPRLYRTHRWSYARIAAHINAVTYSEIGWREARRLVQEFERELLAEYGQEARESPVRRKAARPAQLSLFTKEGCPYAEPILPAGDQ